MVFLEASMVIIGLMCLAAASYKTGLNAFSPSSLLAKDQKKFKVVQGNVMLFIAAVFAVFAVFLLISYAITDDLEAAMIYGLLNTALPTYALAYWVLLEEKK